MATEVPERTRDSAITLIRELAAGVRQQLTDERARTIFTDDLIIEVFNVAWLHRFAEDRLECRRTVREIVSDAVEKQHLGTTG